MRDTTTRRRFLGQTAGAIAATALAPALSAAPAIRNKNLANKVIVLGIDGMDPRLLDHFLKRGEMPNITRLIRSGHFGPLATTMPPQSPVAWSSFISGTNPGGHGIFDFIHRDASSFTPYLSTSRSYDSEKSLKIGSWSIPLKGGHIDLLRRGPAFWNRLEEKGIAASLFKLPANFPVVEGGDRVISGMGTPDLLGTYGTFTYYSDVEVPGSENFTGGRVVRVKLKGHRFETELEGPENSIRTDRRNTQVRFSVDRDPWENVVKINIQDREIIMRQGEWSEWIPIKFEVMPMFASVSGMVRIYLKQVHPHFQMYLSPINIDPMDPTLPICYPSGYSEELSQAVGRFYTQGFPEDTKALSNGIFSNEEFLKQSKLVLEERLKAFEYEFSRFDDGFFFFYFSSIDQNTHMMWRTMDPNHPLYEPDASREVKEAVYYFYRRMDEVLGRVAAKMDNRSVLMVLSDHGFAPFGRELHLSTWLAENGFTAVQDPDRMHDSEFYDYVDWNSTQAYVMGLNGIYLNLLGREPFGSVLPRDAEKIKAEIAARLTDLRDPQTGGRVIAGVYDSREIYSGPFLDLAPDLIVGYNSGYRISDESVLGKFPRGIVGDRIDKWSADHCMDSSFLSGVLLCNLEVAHPKPGLWDLAPTILNAFGLKRPEEMDGVPIFKT